MAVCANSSAYLFYEYQLWQWLQLYWYWPAIPKGRYAKFTIFGYAIYLDV